MKNSILTFLLGIFVTISIAATVPNTGILTIKPATPKYTVTTEDFREIPKWVSKGYQVQHVSNGSGGREYIILVKY
jgi:hypothetical protein